MKQVSTITLSELSEMAAKMYGTMVKGVVDIEKGHLVLDAEMHVDEEQYLLSNGSRQEDLWGLNLYPANFGSNDFIEFDSMINIRPRQHNMSRRVEDPVIQKRLRKIISRIVVK
jgi:Protein of unknown function (DUF5674)